MIYFNCDYNEGAHERILEKMMESNREQTPGYGEDAYCEEAASIIRGLCEDDSVQVHFLVGGTQTNTTVIAAALRPHQGVLAAVTGHINVHETGAVEASGHKVLPLPSQDGKITAGQVEKAWISHNKDEHMVQPKMVYISNPTELGTTYTLKELEELHNVCKRYGLYLFLDGARLGYGLAAADNTLSFASITRLCDVFYIGGTKGGALFGEALVIKNPVLKEDFRYMIKQRGGLLAKGRLLGIQFIGLLKDGLYLDLAKKADEQADAIREVFTQKGYGFLTENRTNQIFVIMPDADLEKLSKDYVYSYEKRVNETASAVRFCTSWATKEEAVKALIESIRSL